MKRKLSTAVAAFSLAVLTAMQFTVCAFADVPQDNAADTPAVTEITEPDVTEPDVTEPDVTDTDMTEPTDELDLDCDDYAAMSQDIFALDAQLVLPEVGVQGFYISDEEMAPVRMLIDEDKQRAGEADAVTETLDASYNYSTNYYYNQLNTVERTLYNNIANACSSFINSSTNLSSSYLDYIQFDSSISSTRLNQIVQLFYYSNPQYFFLTNGYRYGSTYMYPMIYSDYQYYSARRSAYSSINSVTSSWISEINKLSSDIAKEEWIYKKLCSTVSYGSSTHNQSLVGALLENQCVCNGYAMAMVYFCNAAGIDCITVVTENHAWNRVKLQGYWYEIDVTWMDQGSYYDTRWCNKSTAYFQSLDQSLDSYRLSHTITSSIMTKYYTGITLPSCTRNDPSTGSSIGLKVVSAENGIVTLSWNAVSGATNYMVYTYINGAYTYVGTTTKTSYVVSGLSNNVKYGFLVRYYKDGAWSSYTTNDIVYATPKYVAKPKITKATPGNGQVGLNWTSVSGATKYAVYSYRNNKWTLQGTTSSLGMYARNLTGGLKYGFAVKAYLNGAWTGVTSSDIVYATPLAANKPSITKAVPGSGQVALNWTSVSGATKYAVYSYRNSKWTLQGTTTSLGMYVRNLTGGLKYGFAVKAYLNGAWTSVTSSDIVYATPSSAVSSPKITSATAGVNKVTLKWNAVSGASKYMVYTYVNGVYSTAATVTETSCTVSNLVAGIKYGFLVRAYVNGTWTSYSSSDIVYCTPLESDSTPQITQYSKGNGYVTLEWSEVVGASNYAVYTYINGDYTQVKQTISTSCTITGLANGINYGFVVRAYVKGEWTDTQMSDIVYITPGA